ncbi:MAG: hypothetical protein JXM70_05895 [Pirellulales bacterium]|nr:hypothetical protein [Pirellulales bacterium]
MEDLKPNVEMSFDVISKKLTVLLSNDASYMGSPDAGHLLTGLGFNLLPGVFIEDTLSRDSSILLPDGASIIDPRESSDIMLSQDDWGYVTGGSMGHFTTVAKSATNTILSTMNSDSAVTFAGNAASNSLMDSFDYGLQGLDPTPGHSTKRSIRNALEFEIYLTGPADTDWNGLLAYIDANPVVASYGSPGTSVTVPVPEPAMPMMCLALFGVTMVLRSRRFSAQ